MDINAAELSDRMGRGEVLNILDVRTELEYHTFNIGGVNVPLGRLPNSLDELDWNMDDEIIVVCGMGLRSATGKTILQHNGYINVKNLAGGLTGLQKLNKD